MVVGSAREEARRLKHNYVGTEHLLLGLLRDESSVASQVLKKLGVDLELLRSAVEFIVGRGDQSPPDEIELTPRAQHAIELAQEEAQNLGRTHVGPEHVLLGLLRERESVAAGVLESFHIRLEDVRAALPAQVGTPLPSPGAIPMGREPQVQRLVEVLLRRSRNNPVLVGADGSELLSVVRGLAMRLAEAKIQEDPRFVPDMERLSEDQLASLLTGITQSGIRVLGTTTPAGFDTLSARNPRVAELFEPVLAPELPVEDVQVGVAISDDALKTAFAPHLADVLVSAFGENASTQALLVFTTAGAHTQQFIQALADVLFGSATALVEVDLAGDIGRLATYPPGRVWFYPRGQASVADRLRQQPAIVLRLSHAEYANAAAIDLVEYILRTRQVTDPSGRRLDFSRTAIVLTAARETRLDPRLLRLLPAQIELSRNWQRQGG